MQSRYQRTRQPRGLAIFLLAALLFRAYVPVGFMPASGVPFGLTLCPAFAGDMHAHHGHQHSPDHANHATFDNCPFGSVPAAGPLSHVVAYDPPKPISSSVDAPADPGLLTTERLRSHQPRGPPSLT